MLIKMRDLFLDFFSGSLYVVLWNFDFLYLIIIMLVLICVLLLDRWFLEGFNVDLWNINFQLLILLIFVLIDGLFLALFNHLVLLSLFIFLHLLFVLIGNLSIFRFFNIWFFDCFDCLHTFLHFLKRLISHLLLISINTNISFCLCNFVMLLTLID